jgi:hypothetical protein
MVSHTVTDVVDWMVDVLATEKVLHQDVAAAEIEQRFGVPFVYFNDNGNLAIARDVLKEFRRSTEPDVVWDRSERAWRFREKYDPKTGRQAD